VRSQKLQCTELPARVQTSSVTLMCMELNKLPCALSQGLISLDDLAFCSTSAKGDFIIRTTPMHCDSPKEALCHAQLRTTTTSTTVSVETTSNTTSVPQKGLPHIVNSAPPADSSDATTNDLQHCPLGLRGQKPQETGIVNSTTYAFQHTTRGQKPRLIKSECDTTHTSAAISTDTNDDSEGTDPQSVQFNERVESLKAKT
jgi:hypothetical protein